MPVLRRLMIALLALAHLAAAALPCPAIAAVPGGAGGGTASADTTAPPGDAGRVHGHADSGHAAAHHDHAAGADRPGDDRPAHAHRATDAPPAVEPVAHGAQASEPESDEHCHAPPSLLARCPCGCDERTETRVPGSRLGPVLLAAPPARPVVSARDRAPALVALAATRAPALPDKVPIPLFSRAS